MTRFKRFGSPGSVRCGYDKNPTCRTTKSDGVDVITSFSDGHGVFDFKTYAMAREILTVQSAWNNGPVDGLEFSFIGVFCRSHHYGEYGQNHKVVVDKGKTGHWLFSELLSNQDVLLIYGTNASKFCSSNLC